MTSRPDRDEWHLDGADWLAQMGDCTRRQVGALIVLEKRIIGLGYNGTRPGAKGCLEGACPRGRHYLLKECVHGVEEHCPDACACGNAWPCPDSVPPGSSYDTGPGACINSHAEMNAGDDAMQRGGGKLIGADMFVSCEPCEGCVRHFRNNTYLSTIRWRQGIIALP